MNEATKTYSLWPKWLRYIVDTEEGIDIGCGSCPITKMATPFDVEQGDANHILDYVGYDKKFKFVFSSHCLEHMYNPQQCLHDWWQLVQPGGVLIVIVPDEDLYEQGMFPSIFNFDHKHTFTLSKDASWSQMSLNMLDIMRTLPGGVVRRSILQDHETMIDHVLYGDLQVHLIKHLELH